MSADTAEKPPAGLSPQSRQRDTGKYIFWTVFAVGVAAACYAGAFFLYRGNWVNPCAGGKPCAGPYRVGADYSALAGIFILALAIERLLEPFTGFLGGNTENAKDHLRDALRGAPHEAPAKKLAVTVARRTSTVAIWGVATGVGFLFAAESHVLLLAAISVEDSGLPPWWMDLLVTGLVIGAGTKPVHDLVARIEKSKNNAEDQKVKQDAAA